MQVAPPATDHLVGDHEHRRRRSADRARLLGYGSDENIHRGNRTWRDRRLGELLDGKIEKFFQVAGLSRRRGGPGSFDFPVSSSAETRNVPIIRSMIEIAAMCPGRKYLFRFRMFPPAKEPFLPRGIIQIQSIDSATVILVFPSDCSVNAAGNFARIGCHGAVILLHGALATGF